MATLFGKSQSSYSSSVVSDKMFYCFVMYFKSGASQTIHIYIGLRSHEMEDNTAVD